MQLVCSLLFLSLMGYSGTHRSLAAKTILTVTVQAEKHAYANAIISVPLPDTEEGKLPRITDPLLLESEDGKVLLHAQRIQVEGKPYLTFVLPEISQGTRQVYKLQKAKPVPQALGIRAIPREKDVDLFIRDKLFTTYTTHGGPNKPFFYPILTAEGEHLTRRWPMQEIPGESRDHPHHRGLWFTHGDVNGTDLWSEEAKAGKSIHTGAEGLFGGPVCGGFNARTEWLTHEGKLIVTDKREIRIYELPNKDRVFDFSITIQPEGDAIVLGDTKEGTFGLRVPETLAPERKLGGQMINSRGEKGAKAWGKCAEWVDYWGTIGKGLQGIAMFDNTQNLRHPQTWHAREYGLFAVNPFGLHDFGLGPKGIGNYTVTPDRPVTLRYRLLFHKGDSTVGQVAPQYTAYAEPPRVSVQLMP